MWYINAFIIKGIAWNNFTISRKGEMIIWQLYIPLVKDIWDKQHREIFLIKILTQKFNMRTNFDLCYMAFPSHLVAYEFECHHLYFQIAMLDALKIIGSMM